MNDLRNRYETLVAEKKVRARDAAITLDVSEAELVACRVNGDSIVRLEGDWAQLLRDLGEVGPLMGLTRNEYAVIERHGLYKPVEINGRMGVITDEGIDLRLFMWEWTSAFKVDYPTPSGVRQGLQFFNASGVAVHKIYVLPETDATAWANVVSRYVSADQAPGRLAVVPVPQPAGDKPDESIDVPGFRAGWQELKDTHDFFGLLRTFGVGREQALRLGPPERVTPVGVDALSRTLEAVAADGTPIMVFVSSPGCIEIHGGPIHKVKRMGQWLNVLDPEFNLHLREDLINRAYVVSKPTVDGDVTSLELFAANGDNIALLFGLRKPGQPELEAWRAITAGLST